MNVRQLELRYFRNYEKIKCDFYPNCIHVLTGKNAQGKTNLIESIYYLSHLRSFRTQSQSRLIKDDHDFFMIRSVMESHQRKEEVRIVGYEHEKHLYRFNDPVHRYSDFIGNINAVLFCPDDLSLFNQSPKMRRRFLDMELIKLSKKYTWTLNHYQKLLRQRNMILKKEKIDDVLLETLTEQMIEDQVIILNQRVSFLENLMEKTKKFYSYFTSEKEDIGGQYLTFIGLENIRENLKNAYVRSFHRDKMYKQTHLGIHKDDIDFHMNGVSLKDIASQGQKRSFLISLKLALCQIIYEKQKEYPILLLDDVFSELDENRSQKLISILPKTMQVFITMTERVNMDWFRNHETKIYQIEKGHLKEVNL